MAWLLVDSLSSMRTSELPLALAASLAFIGTAHAQSAAPPYDPAIELQLLELPAGPKTFLAVADADVIMPRQLALDVMFTFLTNPFVIYDVAPGEDRLESQRTRVVRSISAIELAAAYGLSERLQLNIALPMVTMTGDGLDPETAMAVPGGLSETGLGDLRLEAKLRLARRGRLRLAGIVGLTLPTSFGSGGSAFLGDDLPSARARLAAQWTAGRLALGANAGVILRKPRELYASEVGQQATWSAAAALRVTERFFVLGEAFGRTGLTSPSLDGSPLEVGGALRVFVTSSLAVVAGGGGGVVSGIGSPELRVFAALGYSPDVRDTDRDGIPNGRDKCSDDPEDLDGFEDSDGCPELDNDGDLRPDATDQCPLQPEDLDGFNDDDGCPELDNDGDGIADLEDKCQYDREDGVAPHNKDGCPITKNDADGDGLVDAIDRCADEGEDLDGFEDGDGCPELDNDGDGVPDDADQCPVCAEDRDSLADDDGCPESDHDADGIPDERDQCPGESEVLNAVDDFDGCPDEGGITIATYDGERILMERAPPFERKSLSKAGELIADQMAMLMLAHPEVTRWLVALAGPKERLLPRHADLLRAHLVRRGVEAERLELLTAVGSEKLVAVAKERVEADAPKVCPSPEAAQRPDRVTPRALPAPASAPAVTPAPAASKGPTTSSGPAAPAGPSGSATPASSEKAGSGKQKGEPASAPATPATKKSSPSAAPPI